MRLLRGRLRTRRASAVPGTALASRATVLGARASFVGGKKTLQVEGPVVGLALSRPRFPRHSTIPTPGDFLVRDLCLMPPRFFRGYSRLRWLGSLRHSRVGRLGVDPTKSGSTTSW